VPIHVYASKSHRNATGLDDVHRCPKRSNFSYVWQCSLLTVIWSMLIGAGALRAAETTCTSGITLACVYNRLRAHFLERQMSIPPTHDLFLSSQTHTERNNSMRFLTLLLCRERESRAMTHCTALRLGIRLVHPATSLICRREVDLIRLQTS